MSGGEGEEGTYGSALAWMFMGVFCGNGVGELADEFGREFALAGDACRELPGIVLDILYRPSACKCRLIDADKP